HTYDAFALKKRHVDESLHYLGVTTLRPDKDTNLRLADLGLSANKQPVSLAEFLRRPEVNLDIIQRLTGRELGLSAEESQEVELQIKYQGYIDRQQEQVERFQRTEAVLLPDDFDYKEMSGLSKEVVEKLSRIRPRSLGQASRISGITPAAIGVLQVHLKKGGHI
ncbi:MAG: tRNA uridine-5-carboxymethylaminomethyl(34) synthesis enzyme MnmG, partial [Deltaproteobacteria bacterium]